MKKIIYGESNFKKIKTKIEINMIILLRYVEVIA